jgi:FKBP-type peptidyl-prolyl cis-trans isomerase SlyD
MGRTMADRTVTDGSVVGIAYELTVEGQKVDEADAELPVEYLHGAMNIVPGLETALAGKKVGDRLKVSVAPEDGYGDYDPEDIEWFPRSDFADAGQLEPGMLLTMRDDEGDVFDVTVSEVTPDAIALDFNLPLAGKTLLFDVEVVSIRDADADELEHGHPHGVFDDDDAYEDDDFEWEDLGSSSPTPS